MINFGNFPSSLFCYVSETKTHTTRSREAVLAEQLDPLSNLQRVAENVGGVLGVGDGDVAGSCRSGVGVVQRGERVRDGHSLNSLAIDLSSTAEHGDASHLGIGVVGQLLAHCVGQRHHLPH